MKITISDGNKNVIIDTDTFTSIPTRILTKPKILHKIIISKDKKKIVNNHKFWSIADKKLLLEMKDRGYSLKEIANQLGRKVSSIRNSIWIIKNNPNWITKTINNRGKHKRV